ncbi:MAG: chemotaxis protein CheW [Thermodesulfobacteriota bacterium]
MTGIYLTFALGGDIYGIDVSKVCDILGRQKIEELFGTPGYIAGIIRPYGKPLPVIDIRGISAANRPPVKCRAGVVTVRVVDLDDKTLTAGIRVDAVRDITKFFADEMEPPPADAPVDVGFIKAVARSRGAVTLLLDIDQLFAELDLEFFK